MRCLPVLLLAACASTPQAPQGGPRGYRATDHLEAAREHDELARQASRWPATTAVGPGSTEVQVPIAWHRTWESADDHERFARIHRGQADALQEAFEKACGNRPIERVRVSPLVRDRKGGFVTESGAVVALGPGAGGPDELLADLRCHQAWMMLAPAGMDDCPLDLPGLLVDAHGDKNGVTVFLSVKDDKLIPELQRRVAVEAETARRTPQ